MKLQRIVLEDRSEESRDRKVRTVEFDPARLDSVRRAMEQMDGVVRTMVILDLQGTASLCVVGGKNDEFVIDVTYGDEEQGPTDFWELVDRAHDTADTETEEVKIVGGGQAATYPRWRIVTRETAIRVAEYWARNGKMDPHFTWQRAE